MPGFLRRHRLPFVIAIAFLVVVGVAAVLAQPRDGVAQATNTPTAAATDATASGSDRTRPFSRTTPDASGTVPGTPGFTPGTSNSASPPADSASPTAAPTATARPATPAPTAPPPTAPPPPPAATAVLVGAGDIANCGLEGDAATAKLLDGIGGTVFTAGDNTYADGKASEFKECYEPTWGRHKNRTRPSPGNHDYHVSGAADYFGYFGANAGPAGAGYYAYNLGGWRIYSLNSEVVSSAEVNWLRADLDANRAACVLAYWHHPRHATEDENGSHGSNSEVAPLWDALADFGAEVVVNGHSHHYERLTPIDGITTAVVGTGGTGMNGFGSPIHESVARNSVAHGVLKLTLSPGRYSAQFVPIAGQSYTDSFSGTCH